MQDNKMTETLVGKSKAIKSIIKQIRRLSGKKHDILIIGEQGCGKSVVAKNIHDAHSRGNDRMPFVDLKLSRLDEKELAAVLFGYEENTPELPDTFRNDLLSIAGGGTILIEEIDTTSLRNQKTILTFLTKLNDLRSSKNESPVDIRVIITVKNDPGKLAENGHMVADLADSLSAFTRLFVPPLRERKEDIPLLVEHFIVRACEKIGIQEPVMDINAISILVDQPWKNNIRELKSVIERSVLFSTNGMFTLPQDLVDSDAKVTKMLESILTGDGQEVNGSLDSIERGLIDSALKRFNFNFPEAAEFLGMSKQSLEQRAYKLGLVRTEK